MIVLMLAWCAAGCGAVARWRVDVRLGALWGAALPGAPIAVVNVAGSLALGLVMGAAGSGWFSTDLEALLVGALGGFTTLSTAMVEAVDAWRTRSGRYAAALIVGVAVAAAAAFLAGFAAAG